MYYYNIQIYILQVIGIEHDVELGLKTIMEHLESGDDSGEDLPCEEATVLLKRMKETVP